MTEAIQDQRADRIDELVELLQRTVGDRVSTEEVAQCLTTALAQLKGSVHPHDLPEMAYQLTRIRLSAAAENSALGLCLTEPRHPARRPARVRATARTR